MTFADPPPGLHAGAVSYGPALNAAAVPVSGEKWPWGDPHAYPYRPHCIYRGFCLQGCKVNAVDSLAAGCRDRGAACGAGR